MAEIRIHGVDELQRKLGRVSANRILHPPMREAVNEIQRRMQVYPVQRPGSSYVRTGTLGRKWTINIKTNADGVTGVIGNNTEYGPYVQAERFQARVHQGRWTNTDEKTVERLRQYILNEFKQAINRALEGK